MRFNGMNSIHINDMNSEFERHRAMIVILSGEKFRRGNL